METLSHSDQSFDETNACKNWEGPHFPRFEAKDALGKTCLHYRLPNDSEGMFSSYDFCFRWVFPFLSCSSPRTLEPCGREGRHSAAWSRIELMSDLQRALKRWDSVSDTLRWRVLSKTSFSGCKDYPTPAEKYRLRSCYRRAWTCFHCTGFSFARYPSLPSAAFRHVDLVRRQRGHQLFNAFYIAELISTCPMEVGPPSCASH